MSDLRRSVTPSHLELLLEYMERHPALALAGPRSRHDQLQARKLWEKVAKTLNKVDEKVVKTGKGWCRYWADLKCKTRRKHTTTTTNRHNLTSWERRVINLLTDEEGKLLPNAHQLADNEYQNITKKRKRSYSDDAQNLNQESNIQTYDQPDKIYIINHIEHTNNSKTNINVENMDNNLKVWSNREGYSAEEHNNSAEEHNNNARHIYIAVEQTNRQTELNGSTEMLNNSTLRHKDSASEHNSITTTELMYSAAEHNNSTTEHNNCTIEHNNCTAEYKTKKTVEELKQEILEFQLKRQKELFETEKRERNERHKLEMDILRLKRDILIKELNNLT